MNNLKKIIDECFFIELFSSKINKLDIFFALGIYPKQKTIYKNFKNT